LPLKIRSSQQDFNPRKGQATFFREKITKNRGARFILDNVGNAIPQAPT
jgi:hypothetical protein